MRKLVHLSDLHFGRIRQELVEPLLQAVNRTEPHLVVISGDLTQRARKTQFQQARLFIDRIEAPCLVVPGNHDVPLDNPPVRLLRPWSRYRRWIERDLEPCFQDEFLSVLGINTVNPLEWQRGRIGRSAVRRICDTFGTDRNQGRTRVLVVHHPLEHPPSVRKSLMQGAPNAVRTLAECGADLVLSGHLHSWRAEPFAALERRVNMIQVQVGTSLSTRVRGEDNDFNLLRLEPGRIRVDRFAAGDQSIEFSPSARAQFCQGQNGWYRCDES
ncbi:MAG: metallophosphoesterase family protein [Geminicoccaceae bacterium]